MNESVSEVIMKEGRIHLGKSLAHWIRSPWRSSRLDPMTDALEKGRRHRHQPHVIRPLQKQVHHMEREKAPLGGWRKMERRERDCNGGLGMLREGITVFLHFKREQPLRPSVDPLSMCCNGLLT
jgi:hypothetical protein